MSFKASPWNRLRGPGGYGDASEIRSPDLKTVKWSIPFTGTGHASLVEEGGRWFTCAADAASNQHLVHCIDSSKRRVAWTIKTAFTPYHRHEFNTYASATPVVGPKGGVVIAPSMSGNIQAFGFSLDGNKTWTLELGRFPTMHGFGTSPTIVGTTAIIAAEPDFAMGGILAVDIITGKVKWHHKRKSADAPYATPLITKLSGRDAVIVPSTAFGLTALDVFTGEVIWQLEKSPFTQRCVGAVTRNGNTLIVTTGSGAGARLAIGFDISKGGPPVQIWSLTRATSYVPTPLTINDDTIFWGDNGVVLRVSSSTGTPVYQERISSDTFASPIWMQNAILNITRKGEVVRISDSVKTGVPVTLPLGEESHSTLCVFGNQVVARTLSKVHVLA
ncbi:MAG: PQQ-binding-like beta-propeller repeat protein [Armatimonadota bacterium]